MTSRTTILQFAFFGVISCLGVSCSWQSDRTSSASSHSSTNGLQSFLVRGVVKELKSDGKTAIIQHDAIPNYMTAMTMPFRVKNRAELAGIQPGDQISFRLLITEDESWIEHISKTGRKAGAPAQPASARLGNVPKAPTRHPLLDYAFTNELGQPVTLGQFKGQALAITFFFTRCPIPDFCPRLSRNFQEASQKLAAMPTAPTNWHFLSISFDTQFDTPAVLRAYAERYHYNPQHWSFLTGPKEQIGELARLSDVAVEPDAGFFNHSFRTLIIDSAGQLQMSFPIGGNLSDAIVGEIIKAAAR